MTTPESGPQGDLRVTPFPEPPHLVRLTYQDLEFAVQGGAQARLLGSQAALPRPWNPSSCTNPRLQAELVEWLDRMVTWLNHDLCWQPADMVPSCWRQHPPLVRELALLADRRWTAEAALTSDPLGEWHHTCLPAFLDRVRADAASCVTSHRDWPGRARQLRHSSS